MPPSSVQILRDPSPLAESWKRLWQVAEGGPFLHPAWNRAFVEAAAFSGRTLSPEFFCLFGEDGDLAALLPLRRDPDGVLRFLSSPRADYEEALAAGSAEGRAALGAIVERLSHERFELTHVPETSPLAAALAEAGFSPIPSAPCPGIRLDEETVRDVGRRQSVRRHEKKLARSGEVVLRLAAPPERERALAGLMDQHVSRWLADGCESLFLEPRWREFYRRLVADDDFDEFGRLHVLEAGGEAVAHHLGLVDARSFVWYKPAYDLNRRKDGPGEVLLKTLVAAAWNEGGGYFDFSRGDEAFKLRFANERRRNLAFRHRPPFWPRALRRLGAAALLVRRGLGAALRRLRQIVPDRGGEWHFELAPPPGPVEPPSGYRWIFGEVDLAAFGAARLQASAYVTAARMARAVERRELGHRVLVVRREADGVPVHFSWIRSDAGAARGDRGEVSMPPGRAAAVVHDCWTSPEERGRGLYPAAIRFLAGIAVEEGEIPWIYCAEENAASRRGILKAGTVRELLVRAKPR